jgi:hypothetical protein
MLHIKHFDRFLHDWLGASQFLSHMQKGVMGSTNVCGFLQGTKRGKMPRSVSDSFKTPF